MARPQEFFARKAVGEAIERLIAADHLTLVVGAGSSVEAGFPTWPALIRRLLERLGEDRGLSGEELARFCDWTMQSDGLIGAAAVVESALGEADFRRWVRQELYQDTPEEPVPGPSARACAKIKALRPDRCEIVTTNYDPVLRSALRDEPGLDEFDVDARTDDGPAKGMEAIVRHLHGYITPGKTFGDIVLSEGHYHAMQGDDKAWQEDFMRVRLQAGPCLFVGTSLTDPNLLRYLYRTSGSAEHVALFTRQQDARHRLDARKELEDVRDATAQIRWERLSVQPLLADFYTDSAQFLWELVWMLEEGVGAPSYIRRLSDWEEVTRAELVRADDPARFADKQDELQQHLSAELDRLVESLADDGVVPNDDERLGIHLWLHLPSEGALVLIGGSDRAWRDASTLSPVPINWETNLTWASIQAFCSGSLASQSTAEQAATRWNHVVGLPLFSHEAPWGRLPVGVLTVGSTLPETASILGRGLAALRSISWRLVERATPLLVPPHAPTAD